MSETPVQAEMPVGAFKGAMFGFSRKQVLAYIENMIAENAGQQERADATVKSLQAQLQQNSQRFAGEKQELAEMLQASEDKLETLHTELEAANAANTGLQEKLDKATEECNGFRARLFAKEQEYLQLKNRAGRLEEQNAELVRRMTDAKEEMEALRGKCDQAQQEEKRREEAYAAAQREAQAELERRHARAEQEARALFETAKRRAEEERKHICGGIAGLGGCVTSLKSELDTLQAQVETSTQRFQDIVKELRTSLCGVEEKVQTTQKQAEKPPVPPRAQAAAKEPENKKEPGAEEAGKTASTRILEALARLLG